MTPKTTAELILGKTLYKNHHSLRCEPTPVGKSSLSGGQHDHKFKLLRPTTRAEASEQQIKTVPRGAGSRQVHLYFYGRSSPCHAADKHRPQILRKHFHVSEPDFLFSMKCLREFPILRLAGASVGVLFSALVLGNHWLQIRDHFSTFNKNTLDLRARVQMWDIAKTRLTQEGVTKTSSLRVVVLVIEHIWATSPPETKPSELSSLYKSTQVPRIREKALVWTEPARHRRTKAFPASGSNDLPLSSPHVPGPHRCADKVFANLPSHVVLPITHLLLLHQALQPALQTPLLRLVFPPRTLPYSSAVASCWFAVYIFQTRAAWYVIWWLQLLRHGNKSAPSSCGPEWPRPSRLQ